MSGRDEALRIVARGVVAPLYFSERAHAVLGRAFELRSIAAAPPASPGDRWLLALDAQPLDAGAAGPVTIDIEAADCAEGLMLRGEAGFVRALLRFEHIALGAAAHIDGAIVLEVSRTAAGAGSTRRSQADALSITDAQATLHWSYLDVSVDAQQQVQRLSVVSDVPLGADGSVWLDATSSQPAQLAAAPAAAGLSSGLFVAAGVIGFLTRSNSCWWRRTATTRCRLARSCRCGSRCSRKSMQAESACAITARSACRRWLTSNHCLSRDEADA